MSVDFSFMRYYDIINKKICTVSDISYIHYRISMILYKQSLFILGINHIILLCKPAISQKKYVLMKNKYNITIYWYVSKLEIMILKNRESWPYQQLQIVYILFILLKGTIFFCQSCRCLQICPQPRQKNRNQNRKDNLYRAHFT